MCEYTEENNMMPLQVFEWNPAIWHPVEKNAVLCCTANGKLQTFKDIRGDWRWYVDKYNIVYWIYQSHLLPEIILNNNKD